MSLRAVALSRDPQRMGFVLGTGQRVLVSINPCGDSAACLVTPHLRPPQRRERGDRDVFVGVPGAPVEGGCRISSGVELDLQGGEGLSTGQAEALGSM